MNKKLLKNIELTTEHFKININGQRYEYNGVKADTLVEYYEVSKKEANTLFAVTKGFNDLSQKMIKKELTVPEYLKEVEALNQLTKSVPNIKIGLNKNNEFVISLNAELKQQYQTTNEVEKPKDKKPGILALYSIEWEERERGWGVRPDGFSFHRSVEEAEQYVKDFTAKQPKEVPDEYSCPAGKATLIEVSEKLHDYVMENGSIWLGPKNAHEYKTYDTEHLTRSKNKM